MPEGDDQVILAEGGKCGVLQRACDWVGDGVSDTVGNAVGDALTDLVNGIIEGVVNTMTYVLTFWVTTPTGSLESGGAVAGSVATMQELLSTLTIFFGVLGLLIAAGRMAWTARAEPIKEMLRMLAAVVFVQALAVSATQMLLRGGDVFSTWLIRQVTEEPMQNSFESLIPVLRASGGGFVVNPAQIQMAQGALLIIMIVVLLATIAQFMFLILRDVLLAIILVFLPTLAAASLTQGGSEAFTKAQGWIVALLLYKPTAAVIYALGVLMVKGVGADSPEGGNVDWAALLLGGLTLVLATLAMPALIKFVAPAAGRGVSNAFSGGAAVAAGAGAVAAGASVAALAATGGASAPATGAAGASTGASTTAPTAAASAPTAAPTPGAGETPSPQAPGSAPGGTVPSGNDGGSGKTEGSGDKTSEGANPQQGAPAPSSPEGGQGTGAPGPEASGSGAPAPDGSGTGGVTTRDALNTVRDVADTAQQSAGPSGAIEEST